MKVYTIGYAGMNISEFIKVLKDHGITMVVDVRRFPKSRDSAFTRENLENNLRENGIKYVFLGESLGGFVRGGYEKYMESSKFREGFNMLLNLSGKEVIVIMCKEKNVKYCHRRFISNLLSSLGFEVLHL